MLTNLHVKNLALIEEAEIDFKPGLNILTGETGAGKSIIIDSVLFALGGKLSKDFVRDQADYALAELIFVPDTEKQLQAVRNLEIPVEDEVIMQRKIVNGRSVSRVNGEVVTAGVLQELASILIDIHGQYEHQSLLQKKKHMQVLDEFCTSELKPLLGKVSEQYHLYMELEQELKNAETTDDNRDKEAALAQFETNEIRQAQLKTGEDAELEISYRKMVNAKKIMEGINAVHYSTGYESENGAGESIGRALREIKNVAGYDEELESMLQELSEIDDLLNDFNRHVSDYLSDMEFGDDEFRQIEERLNTINHLKDKYGNSVEEIMKYCEEQEEKLEKLLDYDTYLQELRLRTSHAKEELLKLYDQVTAIRSQNAVILADRMKEALSDLNFLDSRFSIEVRVLPDYYSAAGHNEVEFMISTNPGERVKPLGEVASGGEMSRIMLAIKTVLADKDETSTLIFDEIDAGISGRTAQKVSEKLALLAGNHQVICITHLPQIAAMADAHYEITKQTTGEHTLTKVHELSEESAVQELARLLGGAEITNTVLQNAAEMKELATAKKKMFEK
ncbi:MAG: DNA repair protein RecN [bacterium]|nr:DNA repair protein RecN [bacterium]